MKLLGIIFLMLCTLQAWAQTTPTNFSTLDWLAGTWNRTNITKAGRTGVEQWELHGDVFKGLGVTLQHGDTVFVEKISIVYKDDSFFYVADVPENKEPVYFKFTQLSDSGFTCENPSHDFPKKIVYELKDGVLHAQVSGNGKVINYVFTKSR